MESISSAFRACLTSVAAHLVAKEQSNGVDDRPGELLDAADGLLQVEGRGVVVAVGDEDDHLLGVLGVGRQLVGRGRHGVVQRGAAAGLDVAQPLAQLVHIGGEILVDEGLVGKVHHEGLVLGVGGLDQVEGALVHRGALAAHGAGVVHHQRNGDRKVGVLEADERLPDAVLEDLEVFLLQVRDHAVAVEHRAVERHLFHVGVQNVALALFAQSRETQTARHPASAPGRGPR